MALKLKDETIAAIVSGLLIVGVFILIHVMVWKYHYAQKYPYHNDTTAEMKAWDHVFQVWDWP